MPKQSDRLILFSSSVCQWGSRTKVCQSELTRHSFNPIISEYNPSALCVYECQDLYINEKFTAWASSNDERKESNAGFLLKTIHPQSYADSYCIDMAQC